MMSPGRPTIRLTRVVPSSGEAKIAMSPRCGSLPRVRRVVVNGMRKPYADLSTRMRSPSTIVGFIEPLGTYIQSATAERNTIMRTKNARKPRFAESADFIPDRRDIAISSQVDDQQ